MFDNAVNGPSKLQFCEAAGLFFWGVFFRFFVFLFFVQQMNIPVFSFLTQWAWKKGLTVRFLQDKCNALIFFKE